MLLITKIQLNSQIEGYKYFHSSSPLLNVIIQKTWKYHSWGLFESISLEVYVHLIMEEYGK